MKTLHHPICGTPRGPARRQPPGFTLLEMVVVVGVIALLATLSVPAFKGLGKSNVMGNAMQQFVGDLNLARQQAIRLHTPVYVVFAPVNIWDYEAQVSAYPSGGAASVWTQLDAQ